MFFKVACAGGAMLLASSTSVLADDKVSVSLDWAPNTNHIGLYVAKEKGFYADAGLEVEIASPDRLDGPPDFMILGVLDLYVDRAAGEDVRGVVAVTQKESGRVVYSGTRNDIRSPRDLSGKTYGGFGNEWEQAIIDTMIRHDGGDPVYGIEQLNASVYEALDSGRIDFTLDVYTWEGLRKELEGVPQGVFVYADHGVPDQHTIVLATRESYLSEHHDKATSFIKATQAGYAYAMEYPDEAVQILLDGAPELVDEKDLVQASLRTMIDEGYLGDTEGVSGSFDPQKMEATGDFLFAAGALKDSDGLTLRERPDFSSYYTNDYLR